VELWAFLVTPSPGVSVYIHNAVGVQQLCESKITTFSQEGLRNEKKIHSQLCYGLPQFGGG
jgi:hypothetical protein